MSASTISRFSYRAFISYSHHDKAWADWLHRSLETYRVPSRLIGQETARGLIQPRLTPIFRDREELATATDLSLEIDEALAKSECLVVICSPSSAASRWVNEEVLTFKRMGRTERIFCLVVAGEPNATDVPGRTSEECLCPALRYKLDDKGRATCERTEPIAADVRRGGDGRADAKLKLIAGMLGVGFDVLKQREQHRRTRRMGTITALALAVMALTSVLAVAALFARHDAVIAQASAERRQKQAEDLVGFMLGDLNDKLNAVGRLDILQAVDDRAMAYFTSLPTADSTDANLSMRVTALQKIGGVRIEQGNTPAGLQAYRAASALAAELVRRSPDDPDRQARYADSRKWVGQAYWYQGDLPLALTNFVAADVAMQASLAERPNDADQLANLAYIHTNIGRVQEARGNLAEAKDKYESVLKIFRGLQARQPAAVRWQSEIGFAWNNLGTLALKQGRLEDAIDAYRADQHIKTTIATRTPDNRQWQEDLVVSNAILGRALALCGDMPGAFRYTRAGVDGARALVAVDASNSYRQELLALYSQQLGGLLRQSGRPDEAATADREAMRILTALVARDPASADYPQDLAQSRLEWARLQLSRGNLQAAAQSTDRAVSMLQALQTKAPGSQPLVLSLAQARIVAGRIAEARHDATAAQRHWTSAREQLAPMVGSGNDPRELAAYAEALLRRGDIQQARPIVARLNAIGYRTPDFVVLVTSRNLAYPVNTALLQRFAETGQDRPATH